MDGVSNVGAAGAAETVAAAGDAAAGVGTALLTATGVLVDAAAAGAALGYKENSV